MRRALAILALGVLAAVGAAMVSCGGGNPANPAACQPAGCFAPQPGCLYVNRSAVLVANTGSSNISVFQNPGPNDPAGAVCGSPFSVGAAPTALGVGLYVVSAPGKSLSLFNVDALTSKLSGPTAVLRMSHTPVGVALAGDFLYVANAEGSLSVYSESASPGAQAPTFTEIPGSPFPAGAGPVGISVWGTNLYVANSQSNNISAYTLDPATGVPTPVPGSPFAAGTNPSFIQAVNLDPAHDGLTAVFVTNAGSNNVSVYTVAGDGSLTPVPGSPFPAGSAPSSLAVGYIFPVTFVLVTNSGSNDISVFAVDDSTGALTPVPGSPFAAGGTDPHSITVGGSEFAGFGGPNGAPFAYVANAGSNTMSVFSLDLESGALTPVSGSPFPVGRSPEAIIYYQAPL